MKINKFTTKNKFTKVWIILSSLVILVVSALIYINI